MRCTHVYPPSARLAIHEPEAQSAVDFKVRVTDGPLESWALVHDLDAQSVVVEMRAERDRALPVKQGISDKLRDRNLAVSSSSSASDVANHSFRVRLAILGALTSCGSASSKRVLLKGSSRPLDRTRRRGTPAKPAGHQKGRFA